MTDVDPPAHFHVGAKKKKNDFISIHFIIRTEQAVPGCET